MEGIPFDLFTRIKNALLKCGSFANSADPLLAPFTAPQISSWRHSLPMAGDNASGRVSACIAFLYDNYNSVGENALVLFLQLLAEGISPEDARHREILQIIEELEFYWHNRGVSHPGQDSLLLPFHKRFPFPGLVSMGVDDQDMFFGRDDEVEQLLNRIQREPIVIVTGLSGCGKSSLIQAGIIPRLPDHNFAVVYTPVYDDILEDVLGKIQRELGITETPVDWVEALRDLQKEQPTKHIVLIVDQFEQTLNPAHSEKSRLAFLKGIPRLVNDAYRLAHVVIVVRADWQFHVRKAVEQFHPRWDVHCVFDVNPLNAAAAREAIIKPLQLQEILYDKAVVDDIIDTLKDSVEGVTEKIYVQPIQLQIVLRELFALAEQNGTPELAVKLENYEASGGVEAILRNHLTRSVETQEGWRLLSLFIAVDNKSRRTRQHSELLDVPAAEGIEDNLRKLVAKGLLGVQETQKGEQFYYLTHDYLVEKILTHLIKNENVGDLLGWRRAEDWLISGTSEWRTHDLLLERNRYLQIYNYRDHLNLSDDARHLLIMSALHYGHEGIGYWLSRGVQEEDEVRLTSQYLLSDDPEARVSARNALVACKRGKDSAIGLDTEFTKSLHRRMLRSFDMPDSELHQEAAAQALWTLKAFETPQERRRVGKIVTKSWLNAHALQVVSYVLTITLVLMLVFGGIYVRSALQGTWRNIYSLKAGNVARVAIDPQSPDRLYVMTSGGSGPHEGSTLFVGQSDTWEMLSRDLTGNYPVTMIVVHNNSEIHIYLAVYAKGIMHSGDGGKKWELLNQGLPSRNLSSLVVDPDNPQTLYVGTLDWRGILRSKDGGNSWEFFDYSGEIYGAMVNRLAFTRANGGALIAGTGDGRILLHPRDSTEWVLGFGLSKGGITRFAVAPSDENYIYAGTNRGIMLRSRDGGLQWEALGRIGNQFLVQSIVVDPQNPNSVFAVTYGNGGSTFWWTQDGGRTWEMKQAVGLPRTGIDELVFTYKEPYLLIAGTTEGLFSSSDNGSEWDKVILPAPLASIQKVVIGQDSIAPVYAIASNSVYSNLDGKLETWTYGKGLRAETIRTVVVDPIDSRTAYAGVLLLGEWPIFKTYDGGQTWEQTSAPAITPVPPDAMLALAQTEKKQAILYAGTLGCGVFRSDDQGETWETFGRSQCSDNVENMPPDVGYLTIDAKDPYQVYAATGQWVYRSTDGGTTWEQQNLGNLGISSPIVGFITDPVSPDLVYLITRSDGFWRSENGGQDWKLLDSGWLKNANPSALHAVQGYSEHLIASAFNGEVWVSTDGGNSWKSIRQNLAISSITSIASNTVLNGKILISSSGDGFAIYTPGSLFGNPER